MKLRVRDIKELKAGQHITIKESKTGKNNILVIKKSVYKTMKAFLSSVKLEDEDYLFKSRKGEGAITIQAANNLIIKWTKTISIKGNYGAYTLRKTFGYIQRIAYGVGFEVWPSVTTIHHLWLP